MTVVVEDGEWTHDTEEEFFADYRRSAGHAHFLRNKKHSRLRVLCFADLSVVEVQSPDRSRILETFNV